VSWQHHQRCTITPYRGCYLIHIKNDPVFSDYREANMTQQIDIEKIKAALNAIEELEQIARSTQPADIKNFCVEYNKTWKKKVDTLLALIDEPISSLLVKLVPYLPTLLVIINMLKAGVEQYCQLHLAEEPPVDK
ncbi:hypothetical protein, partial [Klebsiella pneumoniae]